jgi:hypothetical protein
MTRTLLELGADPTLQFRGKDAVQWAEHTGWSHVIKAVRDFGGGAEPGSLAYVEAAAVSTATPHHERYWPYRPIHT